MITQEISLLIHGPIANNNLIYIKKEIHNTSISFSQIVFVIYSYEKDKYLELLKKHFSDIHYTVVLVNDLLNPGFANLNRQIHSVKNGLNVINNKNFVIKLRNDQSVNFDKLFQCIQKYSFFTNNNKKILTTCSFTRRDRYYHPSDMFLCGYAEELKKYYSIPLQKRTHIETEMYIKELYKKSNYTLSFSPVSPESELCRAYLKAQNWNFKETLADSYDALNQYFYILNSWDIDYRWKKKRTFPFKKENTLILPHYYKISPFAGAPVENVSCILRHEFTHDLNIKDIYFICLSHFLWKLWKYNMASPFYKLSYLKYYFKYKTLMVLRLFVDLLPYILGKSIYEYISAKIIKNKNKYKLLKPKKS